EPRSPGLYATPPLQLNLGFEAGVATPALAERIGRWAAEHTQCQVLEMVTQDHGVHWSCTTLRKLLGSLSAGMAPHSILKFFQVDITGVVRMTSCARYCKEGVGSSRPNWR